MLDYRPHNGRDIRNAAAAHSNPDPRASTQMPGNITSLQFSIYVGRNIDQPTVRKVLPYRYEHAQPII